ncbi:MAG TPA: lysylphosphatidylglycerol synthase transmembrane domain-containing protein [Candidatus Dormibacteraeota bacterium]|nr:lysylphosphatidylglycerol synthase transmembrane domain-containing protein [Candidatus Dormibacteraeota bacterium]
MPSRSFVTSRRLAGVVGVAALGVLLWRAGPGQVWAAVRTLSVPALVITIALNAPITLVRNLRTKLVLRRLGHTVSWWSLTRTQLAGQTLSNLTPAASGDLVRAWMWRRDDGIPGSTGVAAVVYERFLSLVLLLGAGAAFFAPTIGGPAVTVGLCAGGAILLATPLALARIAPARRAALRLLGLTARLPVLSTRTQGLRRMGAAVGVLAADPMLLLTFTATTLAVFVLSGLQIYLLTTGLSAAGNPGAMTVAAATGIYGISQAGGSLSALPFGIGPADAIVVGLLLRTGVAFGIGTTIALLLRATVTLPIALAAAAAVTLGRGTAEPAHEAEQDEPLDTFLRRAPLAAAGPSAKERKVPAWP